MLRKRSSVLVVGLVMACIALSLQGYQTRIRAQEVATATESLYVLLHQSELSDAQIAEIVSLQLRLHSMGVDTSPLLQQTITPEVKARLLSHIQTLLKEAR